MNLVRRVTFLAAAAGALGSKVGAQRRVLPFGLKVGHHVVQADSARWTPQDSGRHPVVIVAAGGPAALDQALPEYLASHGYAVVRAPMTSAAVAARGFGDSTPVALLSWVPDEGASATVEIAGDHAVAVRLAILVVRPVDLRSPRLRVVLPAVGGRPGADARRYRTLCAVTQAILNAVLEGAKPTLSELADLLRAAGVRETYIRAS